MKRICTLFFVFLLSFLVNVNADTLVLETNNGTENSIAVDIKVKNSTRSNNVYEGIISYDTKKINNFSIIQDTGWEVYTKEIDNGIKFMVFSMDSVAVNDTVLFRLNVNYKDIANIGISDVNTANGTDGISLSNLSYSYKYEVYVPPVVDNTVNNNPNPVIPEDVTNNVEPEIKDEEIVPDNEEIKEEVVEEQYEAVIEQEDTPWWLAIIIISVVVLAGIYVGRKEILGGEK
ncbi:MAG: hypothetical protein ACI4OP_02575 [Candidatus Coprovivens sp.]